MVVVVQEQACARVCGNCIHGVHAEVMRGRIVGVIGSSARILCQAPRGFLDPSTVAAMKEIVDAYKWTTFCKAERTRFGMFERACAKWQQAERALFFPRGP